MKNHAVVVLLFLSLLTVVGQAAASTPVTLSLTSSEPASIYAHDVTFTVTTDPAVTATVAIVNKEGTVIASDAKVTLTNGTVVAEDATVIADDPTIVPADTKIRTDATKKGEPC